MKKALLIITLFLLVISAFFSSCSFGNNDDPLIDPGKGYPIVDIEDARKVEPGMTYDQVVSIIGHGQYFKLQSSLYPVYFMWKTSDGLVLKICFTINDSDDDDILLKYGGREDLVPIDTEDDEHGLPEGILKPIFTVDYAILLDHGEIVETICSCLD